jgi:tRNA G26 N,N-dimethylase Trm1
MALTATEQKQIRDTLCAIAVRGARYVEEMEHARVEVAKQFEALKAAAAPPAAKEK